MHWTLDALHHVGSHKTSIIMAWGQILRGYKESTLCLLVVLSHFLSLCSLLIHSNAPAPVVNTTHWIWKLVRSAYCEPDLRRQTEIKFVFNQKHVTRIHPSIRSPARLSYAGMHDDQYITVLYIYWIDLICVFRWSCYKFFWFAPITSFSVIRAVGTVFLACSTRHMTHMKIYYITVYTQGIILRKGF